jgi:hypothetical protein
LGKKHGSNRVTLVSGHQRLDSRCCPRIGDVIILTKRCMKARQQPGEANLGNALA